MKRISFQEQSTDRFLNQTKNFWLHPNTLIGILIAIYLVIGLFVVNQYGESIDTPPRMTYAERSLRSYSGESLKLQDEKGPFFGMMALLGAKILKYIIPSGGILEGWNYMSFIAFAMGVFFFYRLCRRLFNPIPSIAVTLLFSTQPILWGHAFINPKDIPFMSFFLASISLGLEMVDHWQALSVSIGEPLTIRRELTTLRNRLRTEWHLASRWMRLIWIILPSSLVAMLLTYPLVVKLINGMVRYIYEAPVSSILGQLFQHIAENSSSSPVEAYISKAQALYPQMIFPISLILIVCFFLISLKIFPSLSSGSMQSHLILAGCFLGFASDIRSLGPASGILICLYFLYRGRSKVIPFIMEYLAIGAVVTYIFWPNLWKNPITGYLASLSQASDFPHYGWILFAGNTYNINNLPATILPTLLGLQFTEPAVILILLGLIVACIVLVKQSTLRADILLIFAWSIGPIAAAIILDSTIYNNFRHFLFIVPALFIFAGLALQFVWVWFKGKLSLFIPLILLVLLPGIYWIWQLHPYQYVYYNSLAGGEAAASTNFEMDYWLTTYKEGAEYVNQVAHKNSVVYFYKNYSTALPYIRPDLKLTTDQNLEDFSDTDTIYAVIPFNHPESQNIFNRSKVVYQIIRSGAVLAVVKQVNLSDY